MMDFVQSGYYLRLAKEEYKKYVEKLPDVYERARYSYLFLDKEEEIPAYIYTWSALGAGASIGMIDITESVPLKVGKRGLIYQYLRGCKTLCRQYTSSPSGEKAMSPDVKPWDISEAPGVGFLDEKNSPFWYPSSFSEIWLVMNVRMEMLTYNPTDIALTPLTNFIGKKFSYTLVVDLDLLEKLEKRIIPSKPIALEKRIG